MITDLGEIGAVGGILRPLDLTLLRDGEPWNLTGYSSPTLAVWTVGSHTDVAVNGAVTIHDDETGTVRYIPGIGDPIHATAGIYHGRIWVTPPLGGNPEPSGLFAFTISPGPNPGA